MEKGNDPQRAEKAYSFFTQLQQPWGPSDAPVTSSDLQRASLFSDMSSMASSSCFNFPKQLCDLAVQAQSSV
jgi:hypothetical protein